MQATRGTEPPRIVRASSTGATINMQHQPRIAAKPCMPQELRAQLLDAKLVRLRSHACACLLIPRTLDSPNTSHEAPVLVPFERVSPQMWQRCTP